MALGPSKLIEVSKRPSVKALSCKGSESQLRHDHTTTVVGAPDAGVRETEHAGLELATTHVHVGDEHFTIHLKEEKGGVAILPEQVTMRQRELLDLSLRETERTQVDAKRSEDVGERAVLLHFVDVKTCFRRISAGLVRAPVLEVGVEVAGEDFICLRQRGCGGRGCQGDGRQVAEVGGVVVDTVCHLQRRFDRSTIQDRLDRTKLLCAGLAERRYARGVPADLLEFFDELGDLVETDWRRHVFVPFWHMCQSLAGLTTSVGLP